MLRRGAACPPDLPGHAQSDSFRGWESAHALFDSRQFVVLLTSCAVRPRRGQTRAPASAPACNLPFEARGSASAGARVVKTVPAALALCYWQRVAHHTVRHPPRVGRCASTWTTEREARGVAPRAKGHGAKRRPAASSFSWCGGSMTRAPASGAVARCSEATRGVFVTLWEASITSQLPCRDRPRFRIRARATPYWPLWNEAGHPPAASPGVSFKFGTKATT